MTAGYLSDCGWSYIGGGMWTDPVTDETMTFDEAIQTQTDRDNEKYAPHFPGNH